MSAIFRTNADNVNNWFRIKGAGVGGQYEVLRRYMVTKLGADPGGSPADLLDLRLRGLGYTGTLQDKLNRFFQVKTGAINSNDAERLFFQNTALDFT
jgi:hypothetical protein